ncbi:MaoC family dehydratase N-terminal domain-containing protein [Christensenellaceae bacterium OttesenSCG-928-K19]|nr:MaoC family dehydratase N-terminal domain-containing protein [Christensenellaceae bacterium OttesenSCG-928-K19]
MYFEELELGKSYDLEEVVITKEQMLSFAAQYDPLPLHTDEEYARSTKFGALIAPGVMSFMLVWKQFLALDLYGAQTVAGKSTKMEWFLPVYEGDALKGTATITRKEERNPYNGLVEVTVDIYNQKGELALRDWTETVVMRKPK